MSFLDRIAAALTPAASEEERLAARRRAEQLAPSEPWLTAILQQHKQIERLVTEAMTAGGTTARREGVRQLAAILTAHSTAEEAVVYPDIAEFSGKTHAGMAYEEHAMTKIQLAKLEKLDPMSEEWREKLQHIESALQQHMYQEEDSWLPDLARNMPAQEKQRMAQRYMEEYERYCATGAGTGAPSGMSAGAGEPARMIPAQAMAQAGSPAISRAPLQAMPSDGHPGAPDGVNTQGQWGGTGGSDAGAPYPNPNTGKSDSEREGFADGAMSHGGQSKVGYHGSGQLGEREVEPGGNVNSGARQG